MTIPPQFDLVSFVKDDEDWITGDEMLKRAKELNITSGKEEADYLMEHQEEIPQEWRHYCLVFPSYLQDGIRGQRVGCFDWGGEQWVLLWDYVDFDFDRSGRFVRPRESKDTGTLGALPLEAPRFMFAIVSQDSAGQTIQLFKTKKQAEVFFESLTKKEWSL